MKDFWKNQKEMIRQIGNQENNYFLNQVILQMIVTVLLKKLVANGLILQMMLLIIMINIQENIHI